MQAYMKGVTLCAMKFSVYVIKICAVEVLRKVARLQMFYAMGFAALFLCHLKNLNSWKKCPTRLSRAVD